MIAGLRIAPAREGYTAIGNFRLLAGNEEFGKR